MANTKFSTMPSTSRSTTNFDAIAAGGFDEQLTAEAQSDKSRVTMPDQERDPIKLWFAAAEELGEYIGIRFGHLPPGRSEPEWHFLKHTDFDGIGGLAHLLRRRGMDVGRLVQIKHATRPSLAALLRMAPKYL